MILPLRIEHMLLQTLVEQGAVRKPAQHIVVGEVIETLSFVDVIDPERDVVGQIGQQLQLLRMKEFTFGGVQSNHTDRLARDYQRQHGHRINSRYGVLLAE